MGAPCEYDEHCYAMEHTFCRNHQACECKRGFLPSSSGDRCLASKLSILWGPLDFIMV